MAAWDGSVCPRCGHAQKIPVSTARRVIRKVRGKPVRATCGQPTDLGWACPCRSRFHASRGALTDARP